MAVSRTKKGIPAVVVHPTYGAYSGDSKNTTEIHFCKEEKKIYVGDILYSSEKSCLCGSDTASTGGWYKLGRLECDSTAQVNVNVICSIMETYNSAYSGLFVLQTRHEKSGSWSIKKLQWLARIGFSATAIKCVVDGNKAYLYAYKTTSQYSRLFIKVLCESGWNNRIPYLFLADNSTPEASTPGGTTITECCAPTATTATNLASAPVIAAGTTSTNAITVTAGGKISAEFTVPYATKAGSAISATSATSATSAGKVTNALELQVVDSATTTIKYDGSSVRSITVPIQNTKNFTGTSNITLRRLNRMYCATTAGGSNFVSGTPYRIVKLTSYDMFDDSPQDGDLLHLWVQNTITSTTLTYPFYIPISSAGESSYTACKVLYHGQSAGTPKEWQASTAFSAGFYVFVYRSEIKGANVSTSGGWVFLYRNVSTT